MLVEKANDLEQFGVLKGETVQMGFAAEAIGQLMDNMARNLYSRPKEAVLREYSTNALDAQIEAGYAGPIEITLPTAMTPILKIRDRGTGLDMEAIKRVYSQYGASTKRASNDFNGTLGLGGKSAFAYSNRFIVVSIKNGVRIEGVVTRSEDGTAEMTFMDPTPTSDPSGTLIQIPTKRGDDFQAEAKKLYQWFPSGKVKVNGTLQLPWLDGRDKRENALEISPNMFVCDHREGRTYGGSERDDLIIMGNVAYPVRLDTSLNRRSHHVKVFVPNGAVMFMSSREMLLTDSNTRDFLAGLVTIFNKAIIDTVQKHIDAAPTRYKAAAVVANWKDIVPANVVPPGGYAYKGAAIPNSFAVGQTDPHIRVLPLRKSGYHNSHDKQRSVGLHYFSDTLWVEGFALDSVTASHAQKARQYVDENKLSAPNGIVLTHAIPADVKPWLQKIISYDDLKAVKLPRTYVTGSSGRIPGSYDVHTTETTVIAAERAASAYFAQTHADHIFKEGIPAETFRHWKAPLFYTSGNRYDSQNLYSALAAVQKVTNAGYTLVYMRSDRVAKFLRNFPTAVDAHKAVKDGYSAWANTAGTKASLALAIQQDWTCRGLEGLSNCAGQIADPELKQYVELASEDLTSVKQAATMFQRVLGATITKSVLIDFVKRYPLLNTSYPKHTIFYVNAVFNARAAGQKL